jgi:hypothetical protein
VCFVSLNTRIDALFNTIFIIKAIKQYKNTNLQRKECDNPPRDMPYKSPRGINITDL